MGRAAVIGKSRIFLLAAFLALSFAQAGWSDDFHWSGGDGSLAWNSGANWTKDSGVGAQTYPGELGTTDTATFNLSNTVTVNTITTNSIATVTVSNGAVTLGANLTTASLSIAGGSLSVGANTLTVNGDATGAGTLNGNSGTVSVTGNMGVTTYSKTSGTTSVGGNWTVTSYTAGGTLTFNGGAAQMVTSNTQDLGTVTVTGAGTDVQLQDALAAGAVTVSSGTLTTGNHGVSASSLAVNGTFDASGQTGANATAVTGAVSGSGTVTAGGAAFGAGSISVATFTGGSGTLTVTGAVTSGTAFTASSGTTYIGGNVAVTGTFSANGGTVNLNTAAAGAISNSPVFNNLTVSNGTKTLNSNVSVGGALNITGGTLEVGTYTLGVTGSITNSGTLTSDGAITCAAFTSTGTFTNAGSNTIGASGNVQITGTFNGTATDNTLTMSGAATTLNASATLGNLVVSNNVSLLTSGLTLDGSLTISSGTFSCSDLNITVSGNWTNSSAFTAGSGTVTFTGGGTQSVNPGASAFNAISVTKSGGSLTFTSNTLSASSFTNAANGYSVSFAAGCSISDTGVTTFGNTGGLTLATGATYTFTGGLTATTAGTNTLAGTVATGGGAGQNISLSNLTIGTGGLTLNSGSSGTISVGGAVSGTGLDLAVANAASVTFTGSVGSAGNLLGIVTLGAGIAGTGNFSFNGGLYAGTFNVNSGIGSYNVVLGATGTVSAAVNFLNGGTLTISNGFTFTNGVTKTNAAKTVTGTVSTTDSPINFGVTTTTLGGTTVFSSGSGSITLASVTGAGNALTLTSSALTTIDGANLSGLGSLMVDGGGSTNLTGSVSTTTTQAYGDAVTLTGDTSLTATTVTFTGTVSGGGSYYLHVTGNAVFGDATTDTVTGLTELTVSVATSIYTNTITTSGLQTYTGAVTLYTTTTLASTGGSDITFSGAVAGNTAGGQGLTVNTTGVTIFGNTVGGTALASLTTNAGGGTRLYGNVTTSGSGDIMTFGDAVTLYGAVTLNSGGGNINIASLDGADAYNLTLAAGIGVGTTTVAGNVTNLGSGTGAALTVANGVTGLVRFQGTFDGNSGIQATGGSQSLRFDGTVTLGNGNTATSIVTTHLAGVSFTGYDGINLGALTLSTGAVTITSNGSAIQTGAITATGQNLSFVSRAGTVTVGGNAATIGVLTLHDNNAGSTGTVTFNGSLTAGSIVTQSRGYSAVFNGNTTITGDTTFINTSGVTLGNGGDILRFTGGLDTTAVTGGTSIGGTVYTEGQQIDLGAVTLTAATVIDSSYAGSSAAGAAINIASVTGATNSLTLVSRNGATTVTGAATGLGLLTLHDNNVDSTGTMSFQGNLGATGITTYGQNYNVSLAGGTTTISTTAVSFDNTGTLTLGDNGDTLTFTAGLTATAPSQVNVYGTVRTGGSAAMTIGDAGTPVSVTGTSTIGGNSTGLVTLASGGTTTIAAASTLTLGDGTSVQSITAGAINGSAATSNLTINVPDNAALPLVTIASVGGTMGTVTVTQSSGVTFSGAVSATTVTLTDTRNSQTIAFGGDLTATTLNTAAQGYNVSMTGASNLVSGAAPTTFSNTGTLTLGDAATDSFTFTNGIIATAGTKIVQGYVYTTNSAVNFNTTETQIAGTAYIRPGTGLITFGALTYTADGATLTLGNAVAAATPVTFNGLVTPVSGGSDESLVFNVTTGTITFAAAANVGTALNPLGVMTITKSGGSFTVNGNLFVGTLTPNAGAYDVALNGGTTTVSGGTATTFANTGTLTLGNGGDTLTFTAGMTATAPANPISVGGTVRAGGAATMTLGDAGTGISVASSSTIGGNSTGLVTVDGAVSIASGATLTLGDGTAATPFTFSTNAAVSGAAASGNLAVNTTGAVTFNAAVGTNIGTVTVTNSGGTTFASTVSAATVTLSATTGTIDFQDNLTSTALNAAASNFGVRFRGAATSVTNDVTFGANTGNLTLGDGSADVLTFAGGLDTTAVSGTKSVAGTIRTTGQRIDLGNISLGSDSLVDTTYLSAAGANVNLGTVTGGAYSLAIVTGTSGALSSGTIAAVNLRISSGSAVTVTTTVDAIEIAAGGTVSVTETDAVTIGFTGGPGTNLTGISTASNGNIGFTAGGNVTVSENVSANGAGTVSITATGATLTTNAGVTVSSGSGFITLTSNVISLGGNVSSTGGALTLQPSSAATTVGIGNGSTGTFNLDATEIGYLVDGFSSITIGRANSGAVNVTSATFTDPLAILGGTAAAITVDTSLATTGNSALTVTSTSGNIVLNGGVSAAGTGVVDINSGAGFTLANGVTIQSGTGNITIDTTGANAMLVYGNIVTTGAGTIGLTATNVLTMDSDSLIQTGNGAITLQSAGTMTLDVVESTGNAQINLTTTAGSIVEAADPSRIGATNSTSVLVINTAGGVGTGTGTACLDTNVGTLRLTAAGAVYINEATGIALGTGGSVTSSGGLIDITAGGAVTTGGTISTTVGNYAVSVVSSTGGITISNAVTANGSGNVTLTANGTAAVTVNAGLTTTSGAITVNGTNNAGTSVSLAAGITIGAGSGTILIDGGDGAVALSTGTLSTTSASATAVVIRNATTVGLCTVTAPNGTLAIGQTAPADITGAVSQNASMNVGTVTAVQAAAAGTLNLGNVGNTIGTVGSVTRGGAFTLYDSAGGLTVTGPITAGTTASNVTITTLGAAMTVNGNITTNGAATVLSLNGPSLTLASNLATGGGTLILNGTGTGVNQTGGTVVTGGLLLTGAGTFTLTQTGNDADTFAVGATGATVSFTDVDGLVVDTVSTTNGVTATNLTLSAGGTITDNAQPLVVSGTTTLSAMVAGPTYYDITLDTPTNDFGTVVVTNANNVTLVDVNAIVLGNVNTAANLSVTATGGTITDAATTTISVGGLATLDAHNGGTYYDITIGNDDTTNFGSLSLTGNTVTVTEDSDMTITYLYANTNSSLTSSGSIADANGTTIAVTGLATFSAGTTIVLGDFGTDTTNFGSLNLSGTNVTVTEDSATVLTGVNASGFFTLTSAGTITDAAATTIAVTGLATLNAGANLITLGDQAGDTTNFGSLDLTGGAVTITEDSGSLLAAVSAASFTLTSAGNVTQSGAVAVTGLTTLAAGTNSITLNRTDNGFATVAITNAGAVSLNDADGYTLNACTVTGTFDATTNAGDLTVAAAVNASGGTGYINLTPAADLRINGSLATSTGTITLNPTSGNIYFNSAATPTVTSSGAAGTITFSDPVILQATATSVTATGGGIVQFQSTVHSETSGNSSLTVSGGAAGNITFTGAVGNTGTNRLNALSITNANDVTVSSTLYAASVSQTAGSGTTHFGAAVNTNGAGLDLNGNAFTFDVAVTATGTGTATITNSGLLTMAAAADFNLSGAFTQDGAGAVSTAGDVTTTAGNISFAGPVTLTGAVALSTGAGTGNVSFGNAATIGGAYDLTVTAGTGNVSFGAASGAANGRIGGAAGANRIGVLTVVSGAAVTWNGEVFASRIATTGTVGSIVFNQPVNTNAAAAIGLDLTTTGAMTFNNTVTATGDGRVTLSNGGLLTIVDTTSAADTGNVDFSLNGAFLQNGAGAVSIAGDITTTNDGIRFDGAVTLTGNVALDTGAGAGNISFSSTLTGTTAGGQTLTLNAGTGSLGFTGGVGATQLGTVTVSDASGGVTVTSTFSAASLSITNGGAVDLNGTVTTPSGFSSAGTTFDNTGATITTTNNDIVINHTGNVTIAAALSSGSGAVNIDATGAGATVDLSAQINVSTGAVTIDSVGTTTIAPAGDITATGAGTVAFGATLSGALSTAGDVTTNAGNVDFYRAVTLTGAVALSTTAGVGGNITFANAATIDSPGTAYDLTVTAGTGNVSFGAASGAANGRIGGAAGANRIGVLRINSAANVTFNGEVFAARIRQIAGTGTTAFNQAVDTNGAALNDMTGTDYIFQAGFVMTGGSGLDLNGAAVTFNGAVSTASSGTVTVTNTGLLTIAAAADFALGGAFTQDGAGAVSTAGDVTTTAGNISFAGPVTLTGAVALSTGAGTGNVSFGNAATIGGAYDLTVTAGTGNVSFGAASGAANGRIGGAAGANRIGVLTVVSGAAVTWNGEVFASRIATTGTVGSIVFNQPVNTNAAAAIGLDLTTTGAMTFNNTVTATGDGRVTLSNGGLLTIVAAADFNLNGSFQQTGAGAVSTAGDITTTADDISFAGPVTLTGAVALSTGAGIGNVSFANAATIDSPGTPYDLTVTAGTGNVSFGAASGAANGRIGGAAGANRIGVLTVVSGAAVTWNGEVFASRIVTTGTVATIEFFQPVNTSQALAGVGIDLTTTGAMTFHNTVTTAAGGGVTLSNGGLLTVEDVGGAADTAADFNLAGAFTKTGAGAVSIAGDIATNNANISFNAQPVTLTGDVAMNTGAATGNVSFGSTITGTGTGTELLSLAAGTGDVTVSGIIGTSTATALESLTISGNNVVLGGIGSGTGSPGVASAAGTVGVTATGYVELDGTHYVSSHGQTYTATAGGLRLRTTVSGDWDAGAGTISLPGTTLYFDTPGVTVRLVTNLSCGRFLGYRGTANLNGRTLSTTGAFALFGAAYDANDPDWDGNGDTNIADSDDTRFAYYTQTGIAYLPGGGTAAANSVVAFGGPAPAFALSPLDGSTISVDGNFYVNGTSMTGSAAWTLAIPDNSMNHPVFNYTAAATATMWGTSSYAVALNMTVSWCTLSSADGADTDAEGGWVSAASVKAGETNNNVVDGGNNTGWDFLRPELVLVETVKDNVVRLTFNKAIENSNDEINAALAAASMSYTNTGALTTPGGGAGLVFADAFTDALCTTSTNGQGDLTSFYVRTTVVGGTWNTDAVGSGGAAPVEGQAASTDRTGTHKTNLPDLFFRKTAFFDSHKNPARSYGYNTFASYTATVDRAGPVLWKIEYGRAPHSTPASTHFDAHNFFDLYYSERVDVGTDAAMLAGAGSPASNVRAQAAFDAASKWGGDMTASSGTATVAGYFSYTYTGTAAMSRGARDGIDPTNALYRPADYRLRIYLSGWNATGSTADPRWPGWHANVPNPAAATGITVASNSFIRDKAVTPNAVDGTVAPYAGTFVPYTLGGGFYAYWDTDPPCFSTFIPGTSYEIVSRATTTTNLVNRLEFFIQDNSSEDADWNPTTTTVPLAHPDMPGRTVYRTSIGQPDVPRGVRDRTLNYDLDSLNEYEAFYVEQVGVSPLVNTFNQGLISDVNNSLFVPASSGFTGNLPDDPYFTLTLADSGHPWGLTTEMYVSYDATKAYITDLAGNLLPSSTTPIAIIERVPPRIQLTLASVGDTRMYVKFTEPVFGSKDKSAQVSASQFAFVGDAFTITGMDVITRGSSSNSVWDAWFNLNRAITANDAVGATLKVATVNTVFDDSENAMLDTDVHRITDVGLGVVSPLWASDGINSESVGGTSSSLRTFDGTGRLRPLDVILQAQIAASGYTNLPLTLFFDADVDSKYFNVSDDDAMVNFPAIWLPIRIEGLNPLANTGARGVSPYSVSGALRNFLIPETDSEMEAGKKIEFIFRLGNLFCARLTDASTPTSLAPWSFNLDKGKTQRAGVSIFNNVINPENAEKAILTYELSRSGMVSAQVFSLDGSLVYVLHRGNQGKGSYTYTWDGKNMGGRVVARGIYFVRVVGPDIDEIRKVMVVK